VSSTINLSSGNLYIDNVLIEMPEPIDQILEVEDLIIFRYKISGNYNNYRNVGALNLHGELQWIIPEIESSAKAKFYDNISINENNKLIAANYIGPEFIVSLHSGELEYYSFTK
jgi:hypothetical protein